MPVENCLILLGGQQVHRRRGTRREYCASVAAALLEHHLVGAVARRRPAVDQDGIGDAGQRTLQRGDAHVHDARPTDPADHWWRSAATAVTAGFRATATRSQSLLLRREWPVVPRESPYVVDDRHADVLQRRWPATSRS